MKKDRETEAPEDFDVHDLPSVAERRSKATPKTVPEAVLRRLPRYFRILRGLFNADILRVSSDELSSHLGITASQLRQDMKYFDAEGQRGYGYSVKALYTSVSSLLGVSKKHTAAMVGAGNLGSAIASSMILEQRGVWLKGVFDVKAALIGKTVAGVPVRDAAELTDFCSANNIDILIICCDPGSAERAAELASGTGVRGIWNFSQYELQSEKTGVPTENVCTGDSLMNLIYEMSGKNENKTQI